jgi:hypothetical protein
LKRLNGEIQDPKLEEKKARDGKANILKALEEKQIDLAIDEKNKKSNIKKFKRNRNSFMEQSPV